MKIPWPWPWPPFIWRNMATRRVCVAIAIVICLLPNAHFEKLVSKGTTSSTFEESLYTELANTCPQLIPKIFDNVQPQAKNDVTKINYLHGEATDTDSCIETCCQDQTCNTVFMFKNTTHFSCFKASCAADEDCLPTGWTAKDPGNDNTFMVLVRSHASSWREVSPGIDDDVSYPSNSGYMSKACEVGLDATECHLNEACVASQPKSRSGICQCKPGFVRNKMDQCVSDVVTKPPVTQVVVEVQSKSITLPDNEARLTAFAVPQPLPNVSYDYEWQLLSDQTTGSMEDSHAQTLKLTDLKVGTYRFKVIVSGGNVYGEGFGNVTVNPPVRINKPPLAVVKPPTQLVNLPTKKAIIDGSFSTDDSNDLTYKWELVSAPMSYPRELPDGPTLALDNLVEGNYTVKLTVTDKDGDSNSTLAYVDVIKETDYPPIANAGEDIIIHLPQNEVDLYGNQSVDDHGIVNWEWTRAGGQELAADTKNMRTPHPHLSNLEEGVYTFTLKVTDSKGQWNEDQVNVYVKPAINMPPTANAGKPQEISLPKTWVVLDGSGSRDDINITSWQWTQEKGPKVSNLKNPNGPKTNVTGLTKGTYVFKLTVVDSDKNKDSSEVTLVVNQDENSAPVADAGKDVEVTLPQSVVIVNGSSSYDDLRIARWKWTRSAKSLAAGKIVGNSSQEAVLLLVNLVPGMYSFDLKVWDDQGKSATDSISINVKENPNHRNVVQIVLDINITALTQDRLDGFRQSLNLMLRNDTTTADVKVLNILSQLDSNYAVLHFLVELTDNKGKVSIMPGIKAATDLRLKLKAGQEILDLKPLEIDTLVCQNDCSGHGTCQQATRSCICESFWIENFVRRQLMDGKSNCEWSVIYVGIFLSVFVATVICGVVFFTCKKKRKGRSRRRYTRLEQQDHNIELRNAHTSSLMMSESDTEDDEIIFDDDLNLRSSPRNGVSKRNGYAKFNSSESTSNKA